MCSDFDPNVKAKILKVVADLLKSISYHNLYSIGFFIKPVECLYVRVMSLN